MKDAVAFLSVFLFVISVTAQGTVTFNNTASQNYRLWTNNASGTAFGLISGVNAYRIGLYGSTDLGAAESSLSLLLMTTNAAPAAAAGYFNGGGAAPIAGIPVSASIRFQLRVWSFAGGLSFHEALVAQAMDPLNIATAVSPLGTTTLGGGTVLPGALFGTSPGLLSSGFCVACIPEPSAYALGSLGIFAFMLMRRSSRQ